VPRVEIAPKKGSFKSQAGWQDIRITCNCFGLSKLGKKGLLLLDKIWHHLGPIVGSILSLISFALLLRIPSKAASWTYCVQMPGQIIKSPRSANAKLISFDNCMDVNCANYYPCFSNRNLQKYSRI